MLHRRGCRGRGRSCRRDTRSGTSGICWRRSGIARPPIGDPPVEMPPDPRRGGGRRRAAARGAGVAADAPPRRDARERRQPVPPLAGGTLRRRGRAARPRRSRAADYHHLWPVGSDAADSVAAARAARWPGRGRGRIVRCGEFDSVGAAGARGARGAVCRRRQRAAARRRLRRRRRSSRCSGRRCRSGRCRGAAGGARAVAVDAGPLPCRPCHQRHCVPGDFRCLTRHHAGSG